MTAERKPSPVLIYKEGGSYVVKRGEVRIHAWTDIRRAKAAHAAMEIALLSGVSPAVALYLAMDAAADESVVNSYDDKEDETIVKAE